MHRYSKTSLQSTLQEGPERVSNGLGDEPGAMRLGSIAGLGPQALSISLTAWVIPTNLQLIMDR